MRKLLPICLSSLILLFGFNTASHAAVTYQENKDYQAIPANPSVLKPVNNQVTVMEFFSFGCPWCFRFEPDLEKWLATKPAHVNFQRVPVVFETGWDVYAKAYYIANQLGVADKMQTAFFNAIQKDNVDLSTEQNMEQFFVKFGVKPKDFESAYEFSPGIDGQLAKGTKLMNDYLVYQIPTIVVDGKYKIDASMTGGDNQKMLQVTEYLVQKELNKNG